MGICFSSKKEKQEKKEKHSLILSPSPSPSPPINVKKLQKAVTAEDEAKKHVFIITQGTKPTGPTQPQPELAPVVLEKKPEAAPTKTVGREEEKKLEEEERIVPARMSNCTKEELESILIQCGRISRSPSGMGGSGSAGKGRRSSGSKRSYDFDAEKEEGEVEGWEGKAGLSSGRPSPRRRASSRERGGGERKRSKSRERGGVGSSGGRRVSRSPVRKSEGGMSSSKSRQPEKMVSVPATEKVNNTIGATRRNPPVHHPLRSSSPRHQSRSPATIRASSSNNEDPHPPRLPQHPPQSPYRRNPMSDIDTNISQSKSDKTRKATSPYQTRPTDSNRGILHRDKLLICRAKDSPQQQQQQQPQPLPPVEETSVIKSSGAQCTLKRSSSRRFSRDFDAPLDAHPAQNSYTSLLLEDIQNYHHQNTGFSLPACVTKACSILDAVAGLTGSETCGSSNDLKKKEVRANLTGGNRDKFVETELGVDDDLMEPSIQKYVPSSVEEARIGKLGVKTPEAAVPEESTGSNSYVGQARMSSPTNNTSTTVSTQEQNNSVDSSDVCWTSSSWSNSNTCEEVDEQLSQPPQKKMIKPPHKTCLEADNKQQRTNSASHVIAIRSRPHNHRQQIRLRSNLS